MPVVTEKPQSEVVTVADDAKASAWLVAVVVAVAVPAVPKVHCVAPLVPAERHW